MPPATSTPPPNNSSVPAVAWPAGKGDDPVGEFTISGAYETQTGECSWTKQYIGQHLVEYTGKTRDRGIVGEWRIPGNPEFWSGPFFIWPRTLGDLKSAFEKAFLEYELSKPFVDSPPDPVEASDN